MTKEKIKLQQLVSTHNEKVELINNELKVMKQMFLDKTKECDKFKVDSNK